MQIEETIKTYLIGTLHINMTGNWELKDQSIIN